MGRPKRIEDEALLAVAREVFVEEGFTASTRAIAQRAGVSEAVIYQRHPTKEHLFFAAMVPPAIDAGALLSESGDGKTELDRLEAFALAMMAHFRALIPILLPLVTHPGFMADHLAHHHPHMHVAAMHRALVDHLASQREQGFVASNNVEAAALTLLTALHGMAIVEQAGLHGRYGDGVVRAMVRSLWDGLAPRTDGKRGASPTQGPV